MEIAADLWGSTHPESLRFLSALALQEPLFYWRPRPKTPANLSTCHSLAHAMIIASHCGFLCLKMYMAILIVGGRAGVENDDISVNHASIKLVSIAVMVMAMGCWVRGAGCGGIKSGSGLLGSWCGLWWY